MRSKLLVALSMCLLVGSGMARSTSILISPPVQSTDSNTLVCVAQNTDTSNSQFAAASLIGPDGSELLSSGPTATEIGSNGFENILVAEDADIYAYCRFTTSDKKNVRAYIGVLTEEGTTLIHEATLVKTKRSSSSFIIFPSD
ncbi:MAG: hypothetical protein ACU826_10135 [Gammaproteobacteria bacterium]